MEERTKVALEGVRDTSKQLITLSTALLGLMISLVKDALGGVVEHRALLVASWLLFLSSTFSGLWLLAALNGTVGGKSDVDHRSIYKSNVRIPTTAQVISFALGLTCAALFGLLQSGEPASGVRTSCCCLLDGGAPTALVDASAQR